MIWLLYVGIYVALGFVTTIVSVVMIEDLNEAAHDEDERPFFAFAVWLISIFWPVMLLSLVIYGVSRLVVRAADSISNARGES